MVPGPGPTKTARKGRYYFLPDSAEFLDDSHLGGHWWEGHPFQGGDWRTLPSPAPAWVNGSWSLPAGYAAPHCCCDQWPEFVPTSAILHIQHRAPNWTFDIPDSGVSQVAGNLLAVFWPHPILGFRYAADLRCSDCLHSVANAPCAPTGLQAIVIDEHLPEPYRITTVAIGTMQHPVDSLCYANVTCRVRWYGTLVPPGPIG